MSSPLRRFGRPVNVVGQEAASNVEGRAAPDYGFEGDLRV
jgi:hypothetical protein